METLRRLRFIWALLCLLTAAVCAFVAFTSAVPASMPWAIAAMLAAFAFYTGSVVGTLSALWLSGAAIYFGAMVGVVPSDIAAIRTLAFFGGGWAVTAVAAWIIRPALQRLTNRTAP